ncbi:hypothetical protein TU94_08540 [Streptomyces cyaneogriseus subsp. noncyanogenus]|uniref:Uncharacterized protein n=1 Tax=Streptomyces cyaneogriseus subsp. noncyanogenus TaxID=477245 RepID=A0A0C5GBK0_9ACTN|nr:hypothetical protein TU94_08540 [Streptomyces cyaneogriseus subsp. noncyanogenus]
MPPETRRRAISAAWAGSCLLAALWLTWLSQPTNTAVARFIVARLTPASGQSLVRKAYPARRTGRRRRSRRGDVGVRAPHVTCEGP